MTQLEEHGNRNDVLLIENKRRSAKQHWPISQYRKTLELNWSLCQWSENYHTLYLHVNYTSRTCFFFNLAALSATKGEVDFPAWGIMFSRSCSLSSCDLSHIQLMGSCHNYTTLLDMKAGHCPPTPTPLSHTHTQTTPSFFQTLTGQLQTCVISWGHCRNEKHVVPLSDQLDCFVVVSHGFTSFVQSPLTAPAYKYIQKPFVRFMLHHSNWTSRELKLKLFSWQLSTWPGV